ncbi:hypothetical protein [Massilia sp. S19_KUP03_FR1]|uniref:hypothetical protein n=1 Tax=Massilia sp. S19_KUP03_FR1 TaxID=3025503 RepID=UPI002FCD1174
MSYGFRAINDSGIVSVDEDSFSYVYLGKYSINVLQSGGDISFHCVGYPLVFFGLPYGTVNGSENDGSGQGHGLLQLRAGVVMSGLRQAPGDPNTWIASIFCNFVNGGNPGPLYIRVFGLLHLNFPYGAGQQYGARAWDSQGRLIFDTGCRQLRLAGNTYDAELALASSWPTDSERIDAKDASITLPFSMAGKSIMANSRGSVTVPYYIGSYIDFDTGQTIDQYDDTTISNIFWSNGNTLYSRKYGYSVRVDRNGFFSVTDTTQVVYTRVAVIDNNLYP